MPPRKPRKVAESREKIAASSRRCAALPYRPRDPQRYRPGIALVGCGGITAWHLRAYRAAKYRVVALCDVNLGNAKQRRDEFYPDADVTDDSQQGACAATMSKSSTSPRTPPCGRR